MKTVNIVPFFKFLSKNKVYTFVSIFGFAFSLMFVLLLGIYINKEFAYDNFHEKGDRLYRLSNQGDWAGNAPPTGQYLMDNFPEIENYTRMHTQNGYVKKIGETEKIKIDFLLADSAFFNMFSFKLLSGNPQTALSGMRPIVLSQEFALKLFNKIPDVGQQIEINGLNFTVRGIMENMPANTHIQKTDAIVGFPALAQLWNSEELMLNYNNNSFGLYLLAKPHTQIRNKENQMLEMLKKVNWMYKEGRVKDVRLEPIKDVYFSHVSGNGIKQNSRSQLNILMAIALVILALSIINYINLTVAQSGFRGKEVAVKKLMGGKRQRFIVQFIAESWIMCSISMILAIIMAHLAEPVFNKLLATELSLFDSFTPTIVAVIILSTLLTGVVSGLIPALKISSFDPIEIVKGKFRYTEKKIYSRLMVGLQYIVIIALVICVVAINKQTHFLRNYSLGFEQANILYAKPVDAGKEAAFKDKMKQIPGVEEVCFAAGTPVDGGNNYSFKHNDKNVSFQTFTVDSVFFSLFDIDVAATGMGYGKNTILLNKAGMKDLELDENSTNVKLWGEEYNIIGIVDNFHFRNLKQAVGSAAFFYREQGGMAWNILIKISAHNRLQTIDKIRNVYAEFSDGVPFEFEFVDQTIQKWYESEARLSKIMFIFSVLAIVISVMGLFAMTLYYVQQKTKEVGIRKVNGATIAEILAMLNRDFVKWIAISFVMATPIAWYAMHKWLENFAYKTTLSWWIFGAAGIIALAIALITVSWQSWHAARKNPVEALRYE